MGRSRVPWHELIQDIFDEFLPVMSGRGIEIGDREFNKTFRVDYYCRAGAPLAGAQDPSVIRPFDHFREHNIIEYKSIHQTLTEAQFRNYVGRALVLENSGDGPSLQGRLTLTILTTRTPRKLLAVAAYGFERLADWKYRANWVPELDIIVIIQKETRGIVGGDPLGFIQVLEGNARLQASTWETLLDQDLLAQDVFKRIMETINREAYVSVLEQVRTEGKAEGLTEGLTKGLTKGVQSQIATLRKIAGSEAALPFERRLETADSVEELKELLLDVALAVDRYIDSQPEEPK